MKMIKQYPTLALLSSVLVLGLLFLAPLLPGAAFAQGLNMKGDAKGLPLTVDAEEGIEWRQNEFVFIARGNARAVRGTMTVSGDELRAYYREGSKAGSDVWRLDSIGNVVMTTPGEKATGDNAVYDVERGILVLKPAPGGVARLVSGNEEISAKGQLEFWETRQISVARGEARAVQQGRTLFADVLVAHLTKSAAGESTIKRIEAYDRVKIVTAEDTVTASRGTYVPQSGIATLVGSVRMVRGENTLEGCRAVVDTKAGVSRLFACPATAGGQKGGRVKGQLVPKKAK